MPVGHLRINNPVVPPNPAINFIHALPQYDDEEDAQKILEALAAQFKPIMKEWGMAVNAFNEHEWNSQFAGRNWNGGETIEIVLRRHDDSFAPYQFLIYVMCHELAHIKEMNHAHDFQKINKRIREQVSALRAKGYYGDGFWSAGKSLEYEGAKVPYGEDAPMFTCAGANTTRRKRQRVPIDSSKPRAARGAAKLGKTGRQTAIPRKPGGRVTNSDAFVGEGNKCSDDPAQSSFRKQAGSNVAREARLMALEKRLDAEKAEKAALAGDRKPKVKPEQVDDYREGAFDDGLQYEDPEADISDDERRYLQEEMDEMDDDECLIVTGGGDVASGSGSKKRAKSSSASSASKGKGRTSSSKSSGKRYLSSDSEQDLPPPSKLGKSKSKASPTASSSGNSSKKSTHKCDGKAKQKETTTIVIDSDSD